MDYDSHSNSSGSKPPSQEDALRRGKETYEKNQKELAQSLQIAADKDGKYNFAGIEIPETIAPIINIGLDTFIAPISNAVANVVYHQTKNVSKSFTKSADVAHNTAVQAEIIARWAIIFAKPIGSFISANTTYGKQLYSLHRDLKSVCEAVGGDYKHNKVVHAALSEAYHHYTNNLTLILPTLLPLLTQSAFGLQMQRETLAKRAAEHSGTQINGAIDDIVKKHLSNITQKVNDKMAEHKHRQEVFSQFKKTNGNNVYKNILDKEQVYYDRNKNEEVPKPDYLNNREKYLEEWFNKNVWAEVLKQKAEEERALRNSQQKHNSQPVDKSSENAWLNQLFIASPALSAAGEMVKKTIAEGQKKESQNPSSYTLIKKLHEQMQGKQNESFIQEKVVEIFQRLEEEIGGGNTKFAGGLLEKLKESIKPIAEAMAVGKLDAYSLVKLAGEDLVIEHKGKSRNFQGSAAIQKAIDDMCCTQLVKDTEISEKEFLGRFTADHELVKAAIKKTLADMQEGLEKDFFISVMPAEVLEHAGLKTEDIRTHRKHAHKVLYDQVAASIIHIAAMEADMLKTHGVSSQEIEKIKTLSDDIMAGNREKLEQLVDSKDAIVTVVAAESMNAQLAGKTKVWTERVSEAKSLTETIEKAKAERDKPKDAPGDKPNDKPMGGMSERAEDEESKPHANRENRHESHLARQERSTSAEPNLNLGM